MKVMKRTRETLEQMSDEQLENYYRNLEIREHVAKMKKLNVYGLIL